MEERRNHDRNDPLPFFLSIFWMNVINNKPIAILKRIFEDRRRMRETWRISTGFTLERDGRKKEGTVVEMMILLLLPPCPHPFVGVPRAYVPVCALSTRVQSPLAHVAPVATRRVGRRARKVGESTGRSGRDYYYYL